MSANPNRTGMPGTIVVGGYDEQNDSLGESIDEDSSSDVYGEDDATRRPHQNKSEAGVDDYAKTFDSPAQGEAAPEPETDSDELQDDVSKSKARESMTASSSTSDFLKSQSLLVAAAPPSAELSTPELSLSNSSLPDPPPASAEAAGHASGSSSSLRAATPSRLADQTASQESTPVGHDTISAVDIQKLVDDLAARAAAPTLGPPPIPPPASFQSTSNLPSVSQPSSLPPKPSLPPQHGSSGRSAESYLTSLPTVPDHYLGGSSVPVPRQGQPSSYTIAAAPGTSPSGIPSKLPPPPSSSFNPTVPQPYHPMNQQEHMTNARSASGEKAHRRQAHQTYDQFLADERRFTLDAKWEQFPDGSRIFVGNLSAEKVSKHDVFEMFHRYGRLAQISLKSAFGFVQYHTIEDAEAAMKGLQGAVIKGRKLNLEYSRTQKRERDHHSPNSPDRGRGKAGSTRNVDRYDGRDPGARRVRDGYRPARSPSPPRRDDFYGRNYSDPYDRSRDRSRSPKRHTKHDSDLYRRRSPSPPPRRNQPESDRLDIPRRYGSDVPDVQLLLLQEVQREFVTWVQKALYDRGLKSDVMFLNPRFPRDAVIQRQVLEGVHGVIELDLRAQGVGKIPLQVFDRSAGINNVRYDQYQDLDPKLAAELVYRTRSQSRGQSQSQSQVAQPHAYPSGGYPSQYPAAVPTQQALYSYPNAVPSGGGYQQPPAVTAPEIAGMIGQIDNSTLQKLLASLQASQALPVAGTGGAPGGGMQQNMAASPSAAAVAQNSQIDINALLGSLKRGGSLVPPGQPAPPAAYSSATYQTAGMLAPASGTGVAGGGVGGADASQQVQNIMATLAKLRQQ